MKYIRKRSRKIIPFFPFIFPEWDPWCTILPVACFPFVSWRLSLACLQSVSHSTGLVSNMFGVHLLTCYQIITSNLKTPDMPFTCLKCFLLVFHLLKMFLIPLASRWLASQSPRSLTCEAVPSTPLCLPLLSATFVSHHPISIPCVSQISFSSRWWYHWTFYHTLSYLVPPHHSQPYLSIPHHKFLYLWSNFAQWLPMCQHTWSYHITPLHTSSNLILSHESLCLVRSACHALSYLVTPHHTWSFLVLSHHLVSYLFHRAQCVIIWHSHHVSSYIIIPRHTSSLLTIHHSTCSIPFRLCRASATLSICNFHLPSCIPRHTRSDLIICHHSSATLSLLRTDSFSLTLFCFYPSERTWLLHHHTSSPFLVLIISYGHLFGISGIHFEKQHDACSWLSVPRKSWP